MVLAEINSSLIIFLIVVGSALVIGGVSFGIYFMLKPKLKKDDKPTEEQVVQEEMQRVLKPIEDDETAKAVEEYKDEDE